MNFKPTDMDQMNVIIDGIIIPDWSEILNVLYQPIIGSQAISLYSTLYSLAKLESRRALEINHESVLKITKWKQKQFIKEILVLNQMGLISIHKRTVRKNVIFVYTINTPLTADMFYSSEPLLTLLNGTIDDSNLTNRFITYFAKPFVNTKEYEEVEGDFSDLFKKINKSIEETRIINIAGPKAAIDLTKLKKLLKDNNIDSEILKDQKLVKAIESSILLLDISILDVVNIFSSLRSSKITARSFDKFAKTYSMTKQTSRLDEINKSQSLASKSKNVPEELKEVVEDCEGHSPAAYLSSMLGRAGSMEELTMIENLMKNYKVSPAVINLVLNYILIQKNNAKLNPVYFEKIVATIAKEKIDNVVSAIKYISKINQFEKKEVKTVSTIKKAPSYDMSSLEDLM